jgi:hypothetical protein
MNPAFEVQYTDTNGIKREIEVQGWHAARQKAKELALQTGRRTTLRKAPRRLWKLYVIRLDDHKAIEFDVHFTKREAIEFWQQWNAWRDGGVCLFWPRALKKVDPDAIGLVSGS